MTAALVVEADAEVAATVCTELCATVVRLRRRLCRGFLTEATVVALCEES